MKTFARITCVVVLAVLTLAGITSPGHAKGPTDVVASGPGVDDVHLTYTERSGDVDTGTLGDASRLYDMWSSDLLGAAPDLSSDELGPRYVLTWSGDPHGAGSEDVVVQHAYPFAEGGGWVEFLPDQELYGAPIAQGWIQAPKLVAKLVELGAVDDVGPAVAEIEPDAVSVAPEAPPNSNDASSSYAAVLWTGAGLAVVLAAGVVLLRRRRLSS